MTEAKTAKQIDRDNEAYRARMSAYREILDAHRVERGSGAVEKLRPEDIEALSAKLADKDEVGSTWSQEWTHQDVEDLVADAIGDSIDMDWSSRDGARYALAALKKEGLLRLVSRCQKCGGEIQGWLCQSCPAGFHENEDGHLVFDDAPAPEASGSVQEDLRVQGGYRGPASSGAIKPPTGGSSIVTQDDDKLRIAAEALDRLTAPHVDEDGIIDPDTASSIVGRGMANEDLKLKGSFMAALGQGLKALATLKAEGK